MDKTEAKAILEEEVQKYRKRSYDSLTTLVKELDAYEREGASGVTYQLEVQAVWDSGTEGGDIRVIFGIDDGGFFSSFKPLTADFIISPEGKFIDE